MRAVVLRAFNEPLELVERDTPAPRTKEARVLRVLACGVCHTDIHMVDEPFDAKLPLVLGHEVVAEDKELGNVLVYSSWGCGRCRFCRAGDEMVCAEAGGPGFFQDGGYAEYVHIRARKYMYPIGDLDPVLTAPLACAGLTAYRGQARPMLARSGFARARARRRRTWPIRDPVPAALE
jgi:propanol-preferring alcohol dehydrogenase